MLSDEQLKEIKKELEESENPLVLFDDDSDGLASYMLLKKCFDKINGVVIKSRPILDIGFLRKVEEYSPDKVFILDKPLVSQEFIDRVNVPIIWIDHHPPDKREGVRYYNPRLDNFEDNRCVSYWCYKVNKLCGRDDLWVAMVGVVGDWSLTELADEFCERYPELLKKPESAEEALFESKFGELVRIFNFILKGKTSDVNKAIRVLIKVKEPLDILEQRTREGKFIFRIAERVKKEYDKLLEKALKMKAKDKLFVFNYPSGKMSFTGELSNELLHRKPDKIILVAREKDGDMRLSLRSKRIKILPILEKVLKKVNGYGGGHEFAVGGNIKKEDYGKFVELLREELK